MAARVLVVGGGISGLAAAAALVDHGLDPVVLEGAARAGGAVRTERADGYVVETGPVGVLDEEPAMRARITRLGLTDRIVHARPEAAKRWIWSRGRLRLLPHAPGAFLTSDVLSARARARVLAEPFVRTRPGGRDRAASRDDSAASRDHEDESVADFGRRRLGDEAVRTLLDPMATGVYAGDVERLSMASAFPRVAAMEREHGSLLGGMIALGRERRRSGRPRPRLMSLAGGLSDLVDALAASLGVRVQTGARVASLEPTAAGWRAVLEGGKAIEADAALVTVPAFAAAPLLAPVAPGAAEALRGISYAPLALVVLGYRRADVPHALDGFGFLVPTKEPLRALGSVFVSSVYDGRAPEGHVQLDVRLGGATDPEAADLPDDRLERLALETFDRVLGVQAAPTFRRVFRHPRGIPQYEVGHAARVAAAEGAAAGLRRLFLGGNALRGVGVNDCLRDAERLAEQIARSLA